MGQKGTRKRPAESDRLRTMGYEGVHLKTGISVRTLKRLVATKAIPHIRFSARSVRFDKAAIDEWILSRSVPVKEQAT